VKSWENFLLPFDEHLARVGSVCGTHAYIVNMECQPEIDAGLSDLRKVVDDWYGRTFHPRGNCYAITPYLAFQTNGYSDVADAFNVNGAHSHYIWR
jgi:hypothetical protein